MYKSCGSQISVNILINISLTLSKQSIGMAFYNQSLHLKTGILDLKVNKDKI